jgi:ornithine cyclodeaminase/alanine dehydrogenase-like protein (mu-crystallin family)
LLDYKSLVEALREAHRAGAVPKINTVVVGEPEGSNAFVSLVAWAQSRYIATKLVGVFPGNVTRDPPEPSVQGLVALFDANSGRALMTGDGAALTFRKTAADSALGADYLARRDADVLLVVGAGGLAPHVAEAHLAVRPSISRILVWNRNHDKAETVARSLAHLASSVTAVRDLDAGVAEADIVSCVTMAKSPLVKGALLKPGAHVDLIGSYLPDMRESDDDVARRAGKIFVDTRVNCEGTGDVAGPLAAGIFTRADIMADLFDLAAGRPPGRTSGEQVTMYKNVGGGHLDLFTAAYLFERITRLAATQ